MTRDDQMTVPRWFATNDLRLEEFVAIAESDTNPAEYPTAHGVVERTVMYDCGQLRSMPQWGDPHQQRLLQAEMAQALHDGPGMILLRGAVDPAVVDAASAAFQDLIVKQRECRTNAGDHFAKPGANDRIWNAQEKLARAAPECFVDYFGNDMIAFVSHAWLGPHYQVTSQVNVVNPGGQAQSPHRDYHLGFLENDAAEQYPAHVHTMSAMLTLQGAVAHCDMPVSSGPTKYLPHSQKYAPGFLAWRQPEFRDYFEANFVQLELRKGDAVFFNPALFHAAGTNRTTDVKRMANLLQTSSAFGRAMERLDRTAMVAAVYPVLRQRKSEGVAEAELHRVIAATAEGYAFPANLDEDQPVEGLAPASQAAIVRQALAEDWSLQKLLARLSGGTE